MSVLQEKQTTTVEAYLEAERQATEKSEFYNGECFAMAGASRHHNLIAKNTLVALDTHLRDTPCDPYMADMRLHIEAHQHYVYPDVFVVCDEQAYVDEDNVNDATVIIEVLSPSTEAYDRGMKFQHYQSLPSLQEYVLLSQDQRRVEVYHRQPNQDWVYQSLSHPDHTLTLSSLKFSCDITELYRSVLFTEK